MSYPGLPASVDGFQNIADSIDQMIWSTRPDGYHDYYNRRWYEYTGVADGSTDGDAWNEMFHPDDRERAWEVWRASLETGQRYHIEYRLRHHSGEYRWVLGRAQPVRGPDGAIQRWYGTCTDIHDLKIAEQALRESEARFRAMADTAPSPVWVTNQGGIEFGNLALVEFTGLAVEKLLGNVWQSLIHPDDLPDVARRRAEAWDKRQSYVFEARFRRADGEWRWLHASSRPRLDSAGALLGYVGMGLDVTEIRRAEAELRDSEERFRSLADNIPTLCWMADEDGAIFWYNRRWYEYTGTKAEEMEGWGWQSVHQPDVLPTVLERWKASIESGEPFEMVFPLRAADGSFRPFLTRVVPLRDDDGKIVRWFGTNTDIAGEKQLEAALRDETRLLEVVNGVGAALAGQFDLNRLVQTVTDAGVEVSGAQFGAFFYNVLDETGESYMLYTLSGVERSAFDKFPMPRKTAVFGPTFNGEGVVRSDDITKDPRYGKSDTHHGMPKEHLPVTSYLAVPVISRSGEVIGGLFFGHAESARFTERHEQLLVGIAGQAAVAIDNARLFEAAQRELAERRRAEDALRELNQSLEARIADAVVEREQAQEALRQSQKMEAVGQLTGGIAHDFNNLLTVIAGNIDAARRHLGDGGDTRVLRALGNALVGAERAATLTQRLLAFSRRQPLDPKPTDVNRLVTGMSDLLHRTLGETIEVETVLSAGLWQVEADPHQLENAIVNLAVNARDAMPEGGKLTVETANSHLDRAYVAQNAEVSPGQYVAICVSDTGTGMDEETRSRCFEPFFTTKEVGKGTGLGLSMVYGFVKQSGGHLNIYSEPGEGTTVKIYLPRRLGAALEAEEKQAVSIVPEGTRDETILVCEDDDDVRAYTVEVLRELGYRVLEAHDGPSALRLLERQEGRVDLLFTDVVLPAGMTGAVLAQEAREMRPDLKILFTTGYARDAIVHHGRLDAGVELITKPFAYADLAARIRDMLDRTN